MKRLGIFNDELLLILMKTSKVIWNMSMIKQILRILT